MQQVRIQTITGAVLAQRLIRALGRACGLIAIVLSVAAGAVLHAAPKLELELLFAEEVVSVIDGWNE